MATVNRLKKKKQTESNVEPPQQDSGPQNIQSGSQFTNNFSGMKQQKHTKQKQQQYEGYYELSQCNPVGVYSTSTLFPHSQGMNRSCYIPNGIYFSPMLSLQNQNCQFIEKSGDKIQRCGSCKAYMNCYNTIQKKKYTCFICGRQNYIEKIFKKNQKVDMGEQITSSIYQCLSPQTLYKSPALEDCFIFLVDISIDAFHCKMLHYMIAVMKQVLARPELDETYIYFYTYDEIIQQYDFSGAETKCIIMDKTIENKPNTIDSQFLKDIRQKLFDLLDSLLEISEFNPRKGSNLTDSFDFVMANAKQTKAKIYIFQANQGLIGQSYFQDSVPKNKSQLPPSHAKSILNSKNHLFMEKNAAKMIENGVSMSLFIFGRNYKNLKNLADLFKITNSEVYYYTKDSNPDLDKFYYDFNYILGATFFKEVKVELVLSLGYSFNAVYGNFYRVKEGIAFLMNYLEPSRKIVLLMSPNAKSSVQLPYVAMQANINYRYRRQDYMTVFTIVYPLTGYMDRLLTSVDLQSVQTCIIKSYLSSLRMQKLTEVKRRLFEAASGLWASLMPIYKKQQKFPDNLSPLFATYLAMMKASHCELQSINNTPLLDRVVCERNLLQFGSHHQLTTYFNPYMFDLVNLEQNMCRQDIDFVYPNTVEPRFHNTKDGLFLLDNGISLYLFIAKKCDPNILSEVFGKTKLTKNDIITEETLNEIQSFRSSQIQVLIRTLREQKAYGWVPLYVVRCGENTNNQRNLYLNYYMEKYQQFRNYKVSIEQFYAVISKNSHSSVP